MMHRGKRGVDMRALRSLPIAAIAVVFAAVPGHCAGDAAKGEQDFAMCVICHAKDKTNGVGPGLSGVVGRQPGRNQGLAIARQ